MCVTLGQSARTSFAEFVFKVFFIGLDWEHGRSPDLQWTGLLHVNPCTWPEITKVVCHRYRSKYNKTGFRNDATLLDRVVLRNAFWSLTV